MPSAKQPARPAAQRTGSEFVEQRRKAALEVYEREDTPTWRRSGFWTTTLRGLDLLWLCAVADVCFVGRFGQVVERQQ